MSAPPTLSPDLARHYGLDLGPDGSLPALAGAGIGPIAVINHFALHADALYDEEGHDPCTGVEAMLRYAAISGECLADVGGRFLVQGVGAAPLWGDDGPWDLVVVATYPSATAVVALLEDDRYRAAFVHRRAAVARQRVTVSATLP